MNSTVFLTCCIASLALAVTAQTPPLAPPKPPVKIIFDTDIGNDVDDVMALSMLHALQSRGECDLLAVTITKPDELAGPFVNAMNTFYGQPDIPIGFTRAGLINTPSRFLYLANIKDGGKFRYPHSLRRSSDTPPATQVLREVLSQQSDDSVVILQTGFFSNLAALLDTPGDSFSPLTGRELVKRKARFLSVMAGAFQSIGTNSHYCEYNVVNDIPAAQKVARDWPTPIVWSGFEVGLAVPYPAISIERDFSYVSHHPTAEAYKAYFLNKPPLHNHPTWDLTSAIYVVLPDRGYFDLSPPGNVTVENDGFTRFTPAANGRNRFLVVNEMQAARLKEAFVQLVSQPPACPLKQNVDSDSTSKNMVSQ